MSDRASDPLIRVVRRLKPTSARNFLTFTETCRVHVLQRRGMQGVTVQKSIFRDRFETSLLVGFPWWSIQPRELEDFRDHLAGMGKKPWTVNAYLSAVKSVLRECWLLGLMPQPLYARCEAVAGLSGRPREKGSAPHIADVVARVECESRTHRNSLVDRRLAMRNRAIIGVMVGAGLRRDEVAALRRCDVRMCSVKLSPGVFYLEVRAGKGGVPRTAELLEAVSGWLWEWLGEINWARTAMSDLPLFSRLGSRARPRKVPLSPDQVYHVCRQWLPWSPHELRACYATTLHLAGVADGTIRRLLGHASIVTTGRYIRP